MSGDFWQRLDIAARNASPLALNLLLLIFGLVPLHLPFLPPVAPTLVVVSIYYWAIHRPSALAPSAVFGLGLAADLLGGGPLGSNVLVFLAAYAAAIEVRRWFVGATFAVIWCGLAVLVVAATLLAWLIACIAAGAVADLSPGISTALFGIGAYPLLATLLAQLQRVLLREGRA